MTPRLPRRLAALAAALVAQPTFRFAVVGGLNTTIDLIAFNLLLLVPIGAQYPSGAAALAYAIATVNSFFCNRAWTFRSHAPRSGLVLPFLTVNLVGLAIHAAVAHLAAQVARGVALNLAKLAAVGLGFLWSYAANSRWTFAPAAPALDADQESP